MINAMRNAGLDPGSVIADGIMHRFDVPGDRALSKNGWYILFDGDIQAGRFGSWKTGQSEKWCSKTAAEFTPEEKKHYAARMEAARREREKELQIIHTECREWCTETWNNAKPADSNHPYLLKKQVISHGLRQSGDRLLIPVMDLKGVKHGLQFISTDGTKKFKTGTDKKCHFHLIGKPVDNTMVICEGYATGASIHQATGHAVLVSFDAGNLKPVAEYIHKERPGLILIIAADNDQWTDGNPGITKAQDAARAVSSEYRAPRFNDLTTKPTDFNDLHILQGLDAVRLQIFPPPMAEYQPPPIDDEYEPAPLDPEEFTEHPLTSAPFQCLGYNHGDYFYLPKGAPQVKSLKPAEHSPANLLSLAPMFYWENNEFTNKPGNIDSTKVSNLLFRTNEKIGVYDNRRIRGRGAWIDKNRTVLHLGNRLIVNGTEKTISEHKSKWIYEAGSALELDGINTDPMPNAEAYKIIDLCKRFTFEKSISGELLAGWMVIAQICGVLPWRPHILITGAAGSGKSTVSESVIRPVVGPSAICCMGNTTEAGLRGEAGSDARAVLFDEAESGGEHSKRMQAVLELARQSSSDIGYSILKGTQSGKSIKYQPRLCFCFSSIGAAATQQADNDRITSLSLKKDDRTGHEERWKQLKADIAGLLTPDYCIALRARNYDLIPVVVANFHIFSRLLTIKFSSARSGDQYGSFLAGSYSLRSRKIIDDTTAQAFIDSLDWTGVVDTDVVNKDESQCLSIILQYQIRTENNQTYTVGELLEWGSFAMHKEFSNSQATLLRHGIKINNTLDGFYIANKHTAIKKMLDRSAWSDNWGHILARIPGAIKTAPVNFTAGTIQRSTLLPISILSIGGQDAN